MPAKKRARSSVLGKTLATNACCSRYRNVDTQVMSSTKATMPSRYGERATCTNAANMPPPSALLDGAAGAAGSRRGQRALAALPAQIRAMNTSDSSSSPPTSAAG